MTVKELLESLKIFLEEEVAKDIKLKKENTVPFTYVNPYVAKMTLPHKNFMPVDFQVPFILVGMNNGVDDADSHKVSIRILCAVWGGKLIEGVNIPDETGYEDLINLLEKIKNKLIEKQVIKGSGSIERPITYGVYDQELVYPYWYGYLTFDVQLPINEYVIEDFKEYL